MSRSSRQQTSGLQPNHQRDNKRQTLTTTLTVMVSHDEQGQEHQQTEHHVRQEQHHNLQHQEQEHQLNHQLQEQQHHYNHYHHQAYNSKQQDPTWINTTQHSTTQHNTSQHLSKQNPMTQQPIYNKNNSTLHLNYYQSHRYHCQRCYHHHNHTFHRRNNLSLIRHHQRQHPSYQTPRQAIYLFHCQRYHEQLPTTHRLLHSSNHNNRHQQHQLCYHQPDMTPLSPNLLHYHTSRHNRHY